MTADSPFSTVFSMYPILFTIPFVNIPIYAYGTMLGISMVAGWFWVMYAGKRAGIDSKLLRRTFLWTAFSALLGARLLYAFTNPLELNVSTILNFRHGGLVAYGGFIGGFIGALGCTWKNNMRFLLFADVAVPALAMGLGITRVGCLLFGCDYGRPIPLHAPLWIRALGISFPRWDNGMSGAPALLHHIHDGIVPSWATWSAPVYPTQILESAIGWMLFVLLLLVRRRQRFSGQLFFLFAGAYGLLRSLVECLRGDVGRGALGPFSTSQIIGIVSLLVAVIFYGKAYCRHKANPLD